jgi:hypothetical protein
MITENVKQKWPTLSIRVVETNTYRRRGHMITIGKIPKKLQGFFKPIRNHFTQRAWEHFWALVMAITISHGTTIDRLTKALRDSTHRTNHGEFLWRSVWDNSVVMQQIALDMLLSLFTKKDRHLFLIIDDTQTLKRAKKMAGVGKLRHHATGKYGTGHTIIKVSLYYRGVTITWGSWLYVKKEHAANLEIPFCKLTELAAEAIRNASLPDKFNVTVLFDAFYLCPIVVDACKERKWHYIGVGKANRWFTTGSVKRKLGKYGRNVLRNSGKWYDITGLRETKAYRLAERIGMLIKDEKQHLGLGDYRVLRYQAVVRHLHLVDCAYACLTHMGIKTQCAKGQNKSKKVLRLESISKLKDRMRRIVWQENVQDVIKYSHEKPVIRRLEKLLAA